MSRTPGQDNVPELPARNAQCTAQMRQTLACSTGTVRQVQSHKRDLSTVHADNRSYTGHTRYLHGIGLKDLPHVKLDDASLRRMPGVTAEKLVVRVETL